MDGSRSCTSTSAAASSSWSRARPCASSRSSTTLRFVRFQVANPGVPRVAAPSGGSIFTTSAPAAASNIVATGPAMPSAISTTRTPSRIATAGYRSPMLLVAYADGTDSARSSPADVVAAAGCARDDIEVVLGWTLDDRPWLASPTLRGRTLLAGYALRAPVADGRLRYIPVRLSAVPRLVSGEMRPDIAVITGVRRGSELVFGANVGWGPAAATAAERVVVEIDERGLALGGPPIPGNIVATVARPVGPLPSPREPSALEREIARGVVALLPDEPTLQFGPGGVAEAILSEVDRPVHIWSGLVTDVVASLDERGLLLGTATAAYTWGGTALRDLATAGRLDLQPVD